MKLVNKQIGAAVRDLRRRKSMTQADIAQALEASAMAVCRIERGEANLSVRRLAQIVTAVGENSFAVTTTPGGSVVIQVGERAVGCLHCFANTIIIGGGNE